MFMSQIVFYILFHDLPHMIMSIQTLVGALAADCSKLRFNVRFDVSLSLHHSLADSDCFRIFPFSKKKN